MPGPSIEMETPVERLTDQLTWIELLVPFVQSSCFGVSNDTIAGFVLRVGSGAEVRTGAVGAGAVGGSSVPGTAVTSGVASATDDADGAASVARIVGEKLAPAGDAVDAHPAMAIVATTAMTARNPPVWRRPAGWRRPASRPSPPATPLPPTAP